VSWYQRGKTNLDFTEATDSEWQWHQLGRMQVCTSLQTDNHANTSPFLSPNQQRQSTEGKSTEGSAIISPNPLIMIQQLCMHRYAFCPEFCPIGYSLASFFA